MKIQYIHISAPDETRVYDTEKGLTGSAGFIHHMSSSTPALEEWNKQELNRFKRDQEKGIVLKYEILTE